MFELIAPKSFQTYFKALSKESQKKCKAAIFHLKDDPYNIKRMQNIKKLRGKFNNIYRIRAGDYRIIYEINRSKKEVILLSVEHRKDIYK